MLAFDIQSFQRFWGMGELSIHRWKGFELYPVINKKTVYYVCIPYFASFGHGLMTIL
jgi:hypothetical protein